MKKKVIFVLSVYLLPFILIWLGFICTAFSFNPREVFQSSAFWGISVMYWLIAFCLFPLIVETVNEIYK